MPGGGRGAGDPGDPGRPGPPGAPRTGLSEPFVLGERARRDLRAISSFLEAESGPQRARSVVIELGRVFRMLALLPGAGHPRDDLSQDPELRFWSVHSYLVAFLPATRPLVVVRILHGARSPDELRDELRERQDPEGGSLA
ncbi:MAG: type II toxin-antitoxin system RelE/ParE family toxin [Planctomycetes bacterium]|nr:type II toxin-antitoxin system RelE/ParE family toxin [Planctomycetota bacterium]